MKTFRKSLVILLFFTVCISKIYSQDIYEPNQSLIQSDVTAFSNLGNSNYSKVVTANIHNSLDNDFYKIHVSNAGLIKIDLTNMLSNDFDLYLYDPSKKAIDSSKNESDDVISYNAVFAGDYYIAVKRYDWVNANDYTLSLAWTPIPMDIYDPNNNLAAANKTAFATLDNSPYSKFITATIPYKEDSDYYQLHVTHAGQLTIELSNLPVNYNLYLKDSTGNVILKSTNALLIADSIFAILSDTGRYYLFIDPINNSNASTYKLTVNWTPITISADLYEQNNSLVLANTSAFLTLDKTIYNKTINASIHSVSDVDFFKLVIANAGKVELLFSNSPNDYDLNVLKSDGTTLAITNKIGITNDTVDLVFSAAGTYYIKIYSKKKLASALEYQLVLKWNPEILDQYEPNNAIALPNITALGSINNLIEKSIKATVHNGSDNDFYSVNITNEGSLKVILSELPENYDLELYNDNFDLLKESKNDNLINDTVEYYVQKSGKFIVHIFCTNAWSADEYKLALSFSLPTPDQYELNNSIAQAYSSAFDSLLKVNYTASINASIHKTGDNDFFKLNIAEKGKLILILSTLPQNYNLQLFDKDSNLLVMSYKTGLRNDTITYDVENTGTYYINVLAYNTEYSTELYTLNIDWIPNIVSVEELMIGELIIYPNPTVDLLNIEGALFVGSELSIYNSLGIVVMQSTVLSDKIVLDVSNYSKGIYFIRISSRGNINYTSRFIKD